jgi:hypothetical protein
MRNISTLCGTIVRAVFFQPLSQTPQVFFGVLESADEYQMVLTPFKPGPDGELMGIEGFNPGVDGLTNIALTENVVVTQVQEEFIKPLDVKAVEQMRQDYIKNQRGQ